MTAVTSPCCASVLFTPLRMGDLVLPNRVVLAPLTRMRAAPDTRVPKPIVAEYYSQRATAGLIISEGIHIGPMGVAYPSSPGIWTDAQVQGWQRVTAAVHAAGGRIFAQLWHVGRLSDPVFLNGALPVSSSAVRADGHVTLVRPEKPYEVPRALETAEIPEIVAQYARAASNAKRAGFDGVELHSANGYLLDQFLQDNCNKRTDAYGGSIENRARLLMEALDAVVAVWGAARVGVHLSPRCDLQSMGDSNPEPLFTYVVRQLDARGIAFICSREHLGEDSLGPKLRKQFHGVWIANEFFTRDQAIKTVSEGDADAVAWGKDFIANPDLPTRLLLGEKLNSWDKATFYARGLEGYTDYPFLERPVYGKPQPDEQPDNTPFFVLAPHTQAQELTPLQHPF